MQRLSQVVLRPPFLCRRVSDYASGCVLQGGRKWVMANISGRIDALEQRLKQLKVRQQRMESRRRSLESRRARRDDLRRKILVGAVVLAKAEQGEIQQATLKEWLDSALTRPDDRSLFGLKPMIVSESDSPPSEANEYSPRDASA
jgi:hypothetical protein